MTTHPFRGREVVLARPEYDEARARVRRMQRALAGYVHVFDALRGPRPKVKRNRLKEAARADAIERGNCGFLVNDVEDFRVALAQARREGPASLGAVRAAIREYYDQKCRDALSGYELVATVDDLSGEAVAVTREACDIPTALAEYQRHPSEGTLANVRQQWHELVDRVLPFLSLGHAKHTAPTSHQPRPAA